MRERGAPSWITEWFTNDPHGQRLAVSRYSLDVCTEAERAAARAFVLERSHPCTACGRFAFPEPTLCYWCRR